MPFKVAIHHPFQLFKILYQLISRSLNELLHADSIPGRPRPVGRPHYTWKDGAMQDLNALGPRLQLDLLRLAEAGAGPGVVEGLQLGSLGTREGP